MICPNCGEKQLEYVGEAYDDGHIGSAYQCLECDYSLVVDINDEIVTNGNDWNYSIKL